MGAIARRAFLVSARARNVLFSSVPIRAKVHYAHIHDSLSIFARTGSAALPIRVLALPVRILALPFRAMAVSVRARALPFRAMAERREAYIQFTLKLR
jgi:hypothetical protein